MNFTQKQLDVTRLLIKHYPQGNGTDNPEIRRVADSIIDRGGGWSSSSRATRLRPATVTDSPAPARRHSAQTPRNARGRRRTTGAHPSMPWGALSTPRHREGPLRPSPPRAGTRTLPRTARGDWSAARTKTPLTSGTLATEGKVRAN